MARFKSRLRHMDDTHAMGVVCLREHFLFLCEGNHAAALILSQMDFWDAWRRAEHYDSRWITKGAAELVTDLLGVMSLHKIKDALRYLRGRGFLRCRRNPRHRVDQRLQYALNVELINHETTKLETGQSPYPEVLYDLSRKSYRTTSYKEGEYKKEYHSSDAENDVGQLELFDTQTEANNERIQNGTESLGVRKNPRKFLREEPTDRGNDRSAPISARSVAEQGHSRVAQSSVRITPTHYHVEPVPIAEKPGNPPDYGADARLLRTKDPPGEVSGWARVSFNALQLRIPPVRAVSGVPDPFPLLSGGST
jgi:hypothetical protein